MSIEENNALGLRLHRDRGWRVWWSALAVVALLITVPLRAGAAEKLVGDCDARPELRAILERVVRSGAAPGALARYEDATGRHRLPDAPDRAGRWERTWLLGTF